MEMEKKQRGHLHPITQAQQKIVDIFVGMGFEVSQTPSVETEYHNFDALNVPKNNPARDLQDTFWLKKNNLGEVLRTHTSNTQIRYMKSHKPPFAVVAPGLCFRNEATDATHEAQFYQFEAFMVDKSITLSHLKGVLNRFFDEFYGEDMDVRLRPSFFPFVQPGVEVDMRKVKGMKGSKANNPWIEMLGAGMIHPNVLREVGIDPEMYSGFAMGPGVGRLTMLKTGVPDVRMFYNGDLRLVNQF